MPPATSPLNRSISNSTKMITEDELQFYTPSRADGISIEEETEFREKYVTAIQGAGICLDLPSNVVNHGAILFHRYFCLVSINDLSSEDRSWCIARACIFLACKANEETKPRLRDIINTFHRQRYPTQNPMQINKEFWRIKDETLKAEFDVLKTLEFDVSCVTPQRLVLHVCNQLKVPVSVARLAWSILNDTTVRPFCMVFQPKDIACAAVGLAANLLLYENLQRGWYHSFGLSPEQMVKIMRQFLLFYDQVATPPTPKTTQTTTASATVPLPLVL